MRIAAAILRDPRGRTILVKDPGAHDHVLFSRMWQFPAVEVARHPQIELAVHVRATLGIDSLALTELPAARHGVTFRNITLLPYLAHVKKLPKLPRTRILSLKNLEPSPHIKRHPQNRRVARKGLNVAPRPLARQFSTARSQDLGLEPTMRDPLPTAIPQYSYFPSIALPQTHHLRLRDASIVLRR